MTTNIHEEAASESGFVKDKNGKWQIVPMKPPGCLTTSAKKNSSDKAQRSRRKIIPIDRLTFIPEELVESPKNAMKKRKIENPVRKELFKMPQRKSKLAFNNRMSKNFNLNKKKNFSSNNINDGSPLLDIDEADKLLSTQSIVETPSQFPKVMTSEQTIKTTPQKITFLQDKQTPNSTDSMTSEMEFLQIEKTCAAAVTTVHESPMTSVCTLLENATINKFGSKTSKKSNKIALQIEALIKQNQDEYNAQFDSLTKQIKKFQKYQRETFQKILELVEQLENSDCDENKENQNTKSGKLASQVKIMEKKKIFMSPGNLNKVDLRKSTLNKNLTKNVHYELQSPRMKKAVDMYNSIRNECSVLCTPKLDRTTIELTQASVTRSLSRRIQKQCLLLQDTPVTKQ